VWWDLWWDLENDLTESFFYVLYQSVSTPIPIPPSPLFHSLWSA